ncbi:MAG: DUF3352 domain-containing protein [Solirubrobacterales bacterium]|nr:DUF3352 domain-containing protein [Solirubrobacterales bacterium]HNG57521.1 DUF3352 domain-containing protein [Solirubrobacterales bacterium]
MSSHLKKFSVPTILATCLAAFAISACGSSSDGSGSTELAKYAPADVPVYVEGAVQPDSEVAANVDSISETLAGVNLGDMIKDGIESSSDGEVNFDDDVKPWLGENAGVFVQFDPADLAPDSGLGSDGLSSLTSSETTLDGTAVADYSSSSEAFGLVVETTDTDAAQSFIDKQASTDGGSTDGEYEGFSYKISKSDGTAVGIVDDNVVIGSSEAEFKAAVDASKGDNLADTDAFGDLSGHVADGALATVFTNNDPYLAALKQQGFDLGGLYSALGINLDGSGTVISLVPESDEISMQGYSNAGSDLTSGDPTSLIETFPANTVFATGSGDVGPNATKIMNALNEEGIPGLLKPGQVDKFINEASGQIDIKGIIDSLETVAFFVNGTTEATLGGALVATSSDIKPIESSLRGISSLIGLAGDARVQPLPGGVAGFRVFTPELPGRPVVVGVKGDRMVIGIGMKASLNALTGTGQTLADSDTFKAADESTAVAGLDMYANPDAIADLIVGSSPGDPDAKDAADVARKFSYMAAGSSDEDGTFEFNLGLDQ